MDEIPIYATVPPPSYNSPPPPHKVRFAVIGEAWSWYRADMGSWIAAVLLCGLIMGVLALPGYFIMFDGFFNTSMQQQPFPQTALPIGSFLWGYLAMLPAILCSYLLIAGIWRRALMQIRGQKPEFGEIFKLNGQGKQVLIFSLILLIISIVPGVFSILLQTYKLPPILGDVIGILFLILELIFMLLAMTLYFVPIIIVDQKMDAIPAIKLAFMTFYRHAFALLGVTICAVLLSYLGLFACGIGILFTVPSLAFVHPVIYNDFFRPIAPATSEHPNRKVKQRIWLLQAIVGYI